MAELNVQPKERSSSIIPWLLLLAGLAALVWWLINRNNDADGKVIANPDSTAQTTTQSGMTNNAQSGTGTTATTGTGTNTSTTDWTGIDFNAPAMSYEEVSDKNINVRGAEGYGIYGLGENILFDENKATIRSDAAANLKQIVGSIDKRYGGGQIRVYGFTDAKGSADYNEQLAQQRADAVKAWLQSNGIDAGRISVNAVGEAQPASSNATEAGRKQNRRVEIVARKS